MPIILPLELNEGYPAEDNPDEIGFPNCSHSLSEGSHLWTECWPPLNCIATTDPSLFNVISLTAWLKFAPFNPQLEPSHE